MQEPLRIVEVELVDGGDFVGFRLSDDTAILLSARKSFRWTCRDSQFSQRGDALQDGRSARPVQKP